MQLVLLPALPPMQRPPEGTQQAAGMQRPEAKHRVPHHNLWETIIFLLMNSNIPGHLGPLQS